MAASVNYREILLLCTAIASLCAARLQHRHLDLLGSGSSSSGYSYEQRDGVPVSYVHYSSQLEDAYPVYERSPIPNHVPLAPYYTHYATHHPSLPAPLPAHSYHHVAPDASSEEDEDSGSEQHSEKEALIGERGHKGYAKQRGFDVSEAEKLDSGKEQAHHEEEASHAAGHEESAGEHAAHHEEEAAHEGGSHKEGNYHRKGERTTGYHKVYRKDEFKKDSEFYDEGHNGGHYEKYGSKDAKHGSEQASHAKGATHESGHHDAAKGSRGHKDIGRKIVEHRAHEAEAAEDEHSEERQEHASRAKQRAGSRHGSAWYRR